MANINLSQLSDTQKQELMAQFKKETADQEARQAAERKTYKTLASDTVTELIERIKQQSEALTALKLEIFQSFESLVALKQELYEVHSDQQSHTFSNLAKTARIIIGYRIIDRYDDTINEGIALVREYMDSLATDEESAKLVRIVNSLLKRDREGNLRANRVLELVQYATEVNNDKLTQGVRIINAAYKPERSAYYAEADVKNGAGAWVPVPLAITSANFPAGFAVKF